MQQPCTGRGFGKVKAGAINLSAVATLVATAVAIPLLVYLYSLMQTSSPFSQFSNFCSTTAFPVMIKLVKENQFCQVLIFGSVGAYVVMVLNMIYRTIVLPRITGFTSSIVIHNDDPNFNAVIDFIGEKLEYENQGAKCSLRANTKSQVRNRKDEIREWLGGSQSKSLSFDFRPDSDQAIHRVSYQGRTVFLTRNKLSQPLMGQKKPFTPESLTLTVWGSDNSILRQLMSEALQSQSESAREGTIRIYTLSNAWFATAWELALTKAVRPKESVILDQQLMDSLLNDARYFLSSGQWYAQKGIPYRRGYMLYGPPGCGKTSFAQVLAGELRMDLCMMNMSDEGLNDNKFAEYLREAPARSMIVLEDIDAIFVDRNDSSNSSGNSNATNRKVQSGNGVSFSGLLNALDGVASQEGRIVFMTTNHIERLDPALVRPGRCDVRVQLQLASASQMEQFFLRFFPGEAALARQFAAKLPAGELSMAKLQGFFQEILQQHHITGDRQCSSSDSSSVGTEQEAARQCVLQARRLLKPALDDLQQQAADARLLRASGVSSRHAAATPFEHLQRVGLEKYCTVLQRQGVFSMDDFTQFLSDSEADGGALAVLISLSVDLQYDAVAQQRFKLLLSAASGTPSAANFMRDEYALAEVSDIRDQFFAAYQPLNAALEDSDNSDSNAEVNDSTGSQLLKLGDALCSKLARGGRGVISLFNLRRLLTAFPQQPARCVENAAAFAISHASTAACTQPQQPQQQLQLTLPRFLARAGLTSDAATLQLLEAADVRSLCDLLALSSDCSEKDDSKKLLHVFTKLWDCGFNKVAAARLAEIVCSHRSRSGNFSNFSLPNRAAVIAMFANFFGASVITSTADAATTAVTVAVSDGKESETAEISSGSEQIADQLLQQMMAARSETKVKGTTVATITYTATATAEIIAVVTVGNFNDIDNCCCSGDSQCSPSAKRVSFEELQRLAFTFAMIATDKLGEGVVSRLQVSDFLRHTARCRCDAVAAVEHAAAGALLRADAATGVIAAADCGRSSKQSLELAKTQQSEQEVRCSWVHQWLLHAEQQQQSSSGSLRGMSNCAAKFFENGMRDRADFLLVCARGISDPELMNLFGVSNFAQRKKIQSMLSQLDAERVAEEAAAAVAAATAGVPTLLDDNECTSVDESKQ